MKELLGYTLISIPYIVLFIFCVRDFGIKTALLVFGITIGFLVFLGAGIFLIQ